MENMLDSLLKQVFFGNEVSKYCIALVIFLVGIIIANIFNRLLVKKLKNWAEKTSTGIDDFAVHILERLIVPIFYFLVLFFSIKTLNLNPEFGKFINKAMMTVITFSLVYLFVRIVSISFRMYWKKRGQIETFESSFGAALSIIKFIIWTLAFIFYLDNLGFKVSSVIAGLGIGGVAIALAAQTVLKDLFSYFSIIFDHPFEVGDFIIVGELLGTIEHIGIKTTRVRSLSGEQLVFSNSDLTDSRIRNYKRMQKRRVVFKLGVVYETPLKQLKEVPKIIENAVKSLENTVFDRAHFFSYGDFSLIFEVVYYVSSGDYNKYMDIQQSINFIIKEEFDKMNIEFAFPTQTLYLNK